MKIEKIWYKKFIGCYATNVLSYKGKQCPVFATEERVETGVGAILLAGEEFKEHVVWTSPGGSMNTIPVPFKDGEFLAITNFFPVFNAKDASVSWGYLKEDKWEIKVVVKIPYVHRIELIKGPCADYLIISQLTRNKEFTDDWSQPGALYAAKINYNERTIGKLEIICDNMFENHGTHITELKGKSVLLSASRKGVVAHYPPEKNTDSWKEEVLIEEHSSDVVAIDLDSDGEPELAVISGFHGDDFYIYKQTNGRYEKVYALPGKNKFGHAICADTINGKPIVFIGFRRLDMNMYYVYNDKGIFKMGLIDEGIGATNCSIFHSDKGDLLLVANREIDECSIYKLDIDDCKV